MTQEQVAVTAEKIRAGKTSLGIEFGSTRIKAVLIDDAYHTIAAGDYEWASHLEDGLWSYTQEEIWKGLQTAYARMAGDVETAYGERLTHVGHIGFSAMMHGYLAFDESGELLVPFRTWQNTNTHEAHEKLSELFQYNIPERWSVAHLYQAVLNHEEHVSKVDYITTLAGYVHWKLTGEKVLGVGDASGMFPIDPATHTYETEFIKRFDAIEEVAAQPWKLENLLPRPLVAGTPAGTLTAEGAKLLDPTGTLQPGVVLAPPEGDAGTGMVATNSVRVRTGNVSAGTSIFAMVVLEHKLARLHPEVDLVTTPAGDRAGMSHANNFTSDLNAWVGLFGQFAAAIGQPVDAGTLYGTLFRAAIADDVDADCGGLLNYPFRSGEFLAGLPEGRPLFARSPEARMSLGNFMRTQLFSAFSPVKIDDQGRRRRRRLARRPRWHLHHAEGRAEDPRRRIRHPDQGHGHRRRRRSVGHGRARRLSVARRPAARRLPRHPRLRRRGLHHGSAGRQRRGRLRSLLRPLPQGAADRACRHRKHPAGNQITVHRNNSKPDERNTIWQRWLITARKYELKSSRCAKWSPPCTSSSSSGIWWCGPQATSRSACTPPT